MRELLKVNGVSFRQKKRGGECVLENINLTVSAGELVEIYGRSGSGKTTLIEVIAGIKPPQSGKVERYGPLAWVPQEFLLYKDLTVLENMDFFSRIYRYHGDFQPLLVWGGLDRHTGERAGWLSAGYKKMLQLCVALMQDFSLLVLDEPQVGMDETQAAVLAMLLHKLKREGKGILLAAPNTEYDNVYYLEAGSLVRRNPFLDYYGVPEVSS